MIRSKTHSRLVDGNRDITIRKHQLKVGSVYRSKTKERKSMVKKKNDNCKKMEKI
jgi:hypothetical protein